MRGFLVACQYLTVLPLAPRRGGPSDPGSAAPFFPLVGCLLGLILAGGDRLLTLILPPAVVAALLLAGWVLLTGGLHLDGLADSADGLGGGWSRDESLAIMREPGVGAYGVAAVVLLLLLKATTLAALDGPLRWRALLLAPTLGRLAPVLLARLAPPARAEGQGQAFTLTVSAGGLGGATGFAIVLTLLLLWPWGAALLGWTFAFGWLASRYLTRRLGGVSGDLLGGAVEITEGLVLLLVVALGRLGAP